MLPELLETKYIVHNWRNGLAVLCAAHSSQWHDILTVLDEFALLRSDIVTPGGSKSPVAGKLDSHFYRLGWIEKQFNARIIVDDDEYVTPTHKVDCVKGKVALEVEWNNKDPFFDRDLNNFRLLFDLRAIDVGVIITRSSELQEIFKALGKGNSYGNSTTHHNKLIPRIEADGAGGCPVVVFAIKKEAYVDDVAT